MLYPEVSSMPSVEDRYEQASEGTRAVVDTILAADADDEAWVRQLGPALRGATVAKMLRVTPQAVSSNSNLLRLKMRSGRTGYPVFQFDGPHQIAGLGNIVVDLRKAVATEWTVASWLTSPNKDLGGDTPIAALKSGRRSEQVRVAAQRFASALAR